jgi:F5/8 type C domain
VNALPRWKPVLAAIGAYTALTIAYTWPLPRHVLHGVAHDPGDPILNAWILWWTTKAVPLTARWWNAPIFYPAVGTFAFSEHLLGLAPLSAPIIAFTHNATLGYNVTLLATYILCGLGMYFLAYTLTNRHDAAFIAGLAFAFAPYRLAQAPHIQVLAAFWTPVCLAALHRYDRDPLARWAALAAGAWLLQALSNGYFLFFLSVLVVLWLLWFAVARWTFAQVGRLAAFWAIAAAGILPVLLGYKHFLVDIYGFSRGLGAAQEYAADVGSLLHATSESWLWGWLHVVEKPEGELFPGVTLVVLAAAAVFAARPFATTSELTPVRRRLRYAFIVSAAVLFVATALPVVYGNWRLTIGGVRIVSIARADKPMTLAFIAVMGWLSTMPVVVAAARRRSVLAFYTIAAFAMWVFALGPDPEFFRHRFLYQAPYGWLMRLPGFDGLRVPARFWMMALACLSVLAAFAVARLPQRGRRAIVAAAAIGLVLDGWPRAFSVRAEPEHRLAPRGVSARLDLPSIEDNDAVALYQQTLEDVPLYNGFSGYAAPHEYAMRVLLANHDPRILDALTARGSLGVVIDHTMDDDGQLRKFVAAYPGAVLEETHPTWSSYRLPARSGGDLLPDVAGQPLRIKAIEAFPSQPHATRAADGNLNSRWSGGVQQSAADFTIELDAPQRVNQLVIDLGEYWTDFPVRLRLAVSADHTTWTTITEDSAALNTYYAAVRHPKLVPVVYPIGRDNVRFVRLQQIGWGTHDWSIPEVHVLR